MSNLATWVKYPLFMWNDAVKALDSAKNPKHAVTSIYQNLLYLSPVLNSRHKKIRKTNNLC